VSDLLLDIRECHELMGVVVRTSHICGSVQTQDQQVKYKTVELHDETRELEPMQDTVDVRVVHIFVGDHNIVLACHVVSQIMVHDQP
jgi:hypothetical protein